MFFANLSRMVEIRNISITNVSLAKKLIYIEYSAKINITKIYFQLRADNLSKVSDGGFLRIQNSLSVNLNSLQILSSIGNQNMGIVILNQLEPTDQIAKYFNFEDPMQVISIFLI